MQSVYKENDTLIGVVFLSSTGEEGPPAALFGQSSAAVRSEYESKNWIRLSLNGCGECSFY